MENTNIISFEQLVRPDVLHQKIPTTLSIQKLVTNTRQEICDIIAGKSRKKLFIVGPCSIHDIDQALEYGKKLRKIAEKVKDTILIVMRVYFEKPRTTIGWKGLINDPLLDGSCRVNEGLHQARMLLFQLNKIGLPCAYEVLDTITPQYISDLISWAAVGARTTESQVHRQMVSGLSMPVGFKNGTDGNKKIARDAVLSAKYEHCFMGITNTGEPAICKTRGNAFCHPILRGGSGGPNHTLIDINKMVHLLEEKELFRTIMVDCSHGNSRKDFRNQAYVLRSVLDKIAVGAPVIGIMLESNLVEGRQNLKNKDDLLYGVSITDSCISIQETELLLTDAHSKLHKINRCTHYKEG
jgi:3-deoxy-7-phosphoheptulonate synthase